MKYRLAPLLTTALALALNSLRSKARKHLLGYSWEFLSPVIYAVCFLLVKTSISTSSNQTEDHLISVLRVFVGVTLMQAWVQMLQQTAGFITHYRALLRGMTISEKPLILSLVFEQAFGLAIRFLTVVIAFLVLGPGLPSSWGSWGWIALALMGLVLSAVALGLIIAPWAALYPDFGMAIRSAMLPLMLLSPVFYAATREPTLPLFWLNCGNPMASVLATLMDALVGESPFYGYVLLGWIVFSSGLLMFGFRNLKSQIPILLERLN